LEGKLEMLTDSIRGQTKSMEGWIERVVKVEMAQNSRRRRAS
jgi:hypothetical protein